MIERPTIEARPPGTPIRRRLPGLVTVLLSCTAIILLATLIWTLSATRQLDHQIDQLSVELSLLQRAERLKKERFKIADRDRELIQNVMRQCRNVADLPDLGGNRMVSYLINSDVIVFSLPEGNHQLTVTCNWEPNGRQPAASAKEQTADEEPSLRGRESWTLPLTGGGYFWEIVHQLHDESRVRWELTGNRTDFQTQQETLPLPPVRLSGASWGSTGHTSFLNLVGLNDVMRKQVSLDPQPLMLGRMSKSGKQDKMPIRIRFEVTLVSDAPAVFTALDAQTLTRMERTANLGEYLGDGRYRVRLDDGTGKSGDAR